MNSGRRSDNSAPNGRASDDDLVAMTVRGDLSAFEELVRRYRDPMTRLAYRFLGNVDDAQDVSQDGFVRAYRQLRRYRNGTRFDRWLSRIVANVARDVLRRRTRVGPIPGADEVDSIPDPGPDPAQSASASEIGSALERELAALPDDWRIVFALHEQEGFKHDEIAQLLGENVRTVRWRLYKGRQRLRSRLAPYLSD